jgi:ribosomal protein S8
MKDKLRELLEEILEWLKNDGFIEDIHYDEQSIIDRIKEVLGEVSHGDR